MLVMLFTFSWHLAGRDLANRTTMEGIKLTTYVPQIDNKICPSNQFNCDLRSGHVKCIPASKRCDGPLDCPNDFDEFECPLIMQEFDIAGETLHILFHSFYFYSCTIFNFCSLGRFLPRELINQKQLQIQRQTCFYQTYISSNISIRSKIQES